MATERPLQKLSKPVAGDYSSDQYRLMKANASGQWEKCSTLGERCAGALFEGAGSGDNGQVYTIGEGKVTAGGTIAAWDPLVTDANAAAVAQTDGAQHVFGWAIESAASGDDFTYLPVPTGTRAPVAKSYKEIAFEIDAADIADGDIITDWVPGFAGTLEKFDAVCTKTVTTAAKASDLDLNIGAAAVTGGQVALAGTYALGAQENGAAITAANAFTATDAISIVASSTTTFIEGRFKLVITVSQAE